MHSPVKLWRNQKKLAGLLGKTGSIISWTIIRVPPARFADLAPYPVVLVRLDSGVRFMCQLVDWDSQHLRLGQRVILVVRRVLEPTLEGVIPYGIKAKPLW